LQSVEWTVGEILCKAERRDNVQQFGGAVYYATYKQVVKKIVGAAPRITWELQLNILATEFLAQIGNFPFDAKFVY
jgi:hypothetical protein